MNSILIGFSSTAVAVFGVCNRLQGLVTVGVHGINNGLIPIVAYNLGAGKKDRIFSGVRWAMFDSAAIYTVIFFCLEFFPGVILRLFGASDQMLRIGIPALRILAVSYFVSIVCLVFSSAFQGLGLGQTSMYLTMTRQVILPVVLIGLMSRTGNLQWIWGSFVLAEALSIPLGVWLWKREKKKL